MLYPYMTLADETEIVHSQILDGEKVVVHFERPTEEGFDSARFELPSYELLYGEGYSQNELDFFRELLQKNACSIYKTAKGKIELNC